MPIKSALSYCAYNISTLARKEPNNYTVAELKDLLREKGLLPVGNKSELLNRLTNYNPNIWTELNKAHVCVVQSGGRSNEEGMLLREGATIRDNGQDMQNNESTIEDSLTVNKLIRRENELLKRERALLQRELDIIRQEGAMSRSASRLNEDGILSPTNTNISESVRAIRDLLGEFDGSKSTFWKWEQQIRLLRIAYG